MTMTKHFFIVFIFALAATTGFCQNCSCITGTKDKQSGIKSRGGVTSSLDYYSLLFQKITNYNDSTVAPEYLLVLNAASDVVLSDSMLKSKGTFELLFRDSSKVSIENATCFNNQMPFGFCNTFSATITKEQLEIISKNPILSLNAFGILATSFKEKKQKEQQKIATCLLND